MKLQQYNFETVWRVRAPVAAVEAVIEDVASWPRWWPGLIDIDIRHKTAEVVGSSAVLVWQAQLGYKLRFQITITAHKPGRAIDFTSLGDLTGSGSWNFSALDGDTAMTIIWQVHTTKVWMNLLAPLLRPLFVYYHHRLMYAGEQGLRNYMVNQQT